MTASKWSTSNNEVYFLSQLPKRSSRRTKNLSFENVIGIFYAKVHQKVLKHQTKIELGVMKTEYILTILAELFLFQNNRITLWQWSTQWSKSFSKNYCALGWTMEDAERNDGWSFCFSMVNNEEWILSAWSKSRVKKAKSWKKKLQGKIEESERKWENIPRQ